MRDREKEEIDLGLILVKKSLENLIFVTHEVHAIVKGRELRDVYRNLQRQRVLKSSRDISRYADNIVSELKNLEISLRDAEAILKQKAQQHEQQPTNTP